MQYKAIVKTAEIRETKNGSKFLSMTVGIPGGEEIKSIMWDYSLEAPKIGSQLRMEVQEETYAGSKQFKVQSFFEDTFGAEELSEFMPKTTKDIPLMMTYLWGVIDNMTNRDVQAVVRHIVDEYEELISQAPAAKGNHHAFLGGLIEHITELCEIYNKIIGHFRLLDHDKVYFGLIMHDLGKIFEYRWNRGTLEYADQGQLVPHIPMSTMLLTRAFDKLGTPEQLQLELIHICQSHHLKEEWGSPVKPKTLEAMMVHYLDNLHAQMFAAIAHVEKHMDSVEAFTPKLFTAGNVGIMIPKKQEEVITEYEDMEIPF
jgi:3'-5' exoribonuclease